MALDICSELEGKYLEAWERPEQVEFMANVMGIDKKEAFRCRWRYLKDDLDTLEASPSHPITDLWIQKIKDEMADIEKRAVMKKPRELVENPNKITDEMVYQAKKVPVTSLVDFKHGKALAWCHEDKRPSLYYGSRLNLAVCPVCDKKFDSIGVLMHRDGYSFKEAVRHLCM